MMTDFTVKLSSVYYTGELLMKNMVAIMYEIMVVMLYSMIVWLFLATSSYSA